MAEIKFVGTGGAFDFEYGNSAALLNFQGKNILVDCGHTVFPALQKNNLALLPDYLLLTHLHDDHCGSATTLAYFQYFFGGKKLKLLYPSESYKIVLRSFFQHVLIHPEEFIEWIPLNTLHGITAVDTKGKHYFDMQTWGFIFEDESEILGYSGDLNDPDFFFSNLPKSRKTTRVFHDITFNPLAKSAHALYSEVAKNLKNYPIFGYHCNPNFAPIDNEIPLVANHPELLVF